MVIDPGASIDLGVWPCLFCRDNSRRPDVSVPVCWASVIGEPFQSTQRGSHAKGSATPRFPFHFPLCVIWSQSNWREKNSIEMDSNPVVSICSPVQSATPTQPSIGYAPHVVVYLIHLIISSHPPPHTLLQTGSVRTRHARVASYPATKTHDARPDPRDAGAVGQCLHGTQPPPLLLLVVVGCRGPDARGQGKKSIGNGNKR